MKNAKIHIGDKLERGFQWPFSGLWLTSMLVKILICDFYEDRSNSHQICGWHKFGVVSEYAGWQNQVPKVLDKLKRMKWIYTDEI